MSLLIARDAHDVAAYVLRYLSAVEPLLSASTIENRRRSLAVFVTWCEERAIARPHDVTRPMLERYRRYLFHYRKADGKPLSLGCQFMRLESVRAFFKWLSRENHVLYNPASELELPRVVRQLPRTLLSAEEADRVINQPDIQTPVGLRNRAILETFYSTGIRRMELINLTLYNLDTERGTLMIREGKGKKDRFIPIGERAVLWLEKYLRDARPLWTREPDAGRLFLTQHGKPMSIGTVACLVRDCIAQADIGKRGSCHVFRHSMATLMLEHGAELRFIQAMLGHANITTTEIYTQVSIKKLQEIHAATHPARLKRSGVKTLDEAT